MEPTDGLCPDCNHRMEAIAIEKRGYNLAWKCHYCMATWTKVCDHCLKGSHTTEEHDPMRPYIDAAEKVLDEKYGRK